MSRPILAQINLAALRDNLALARAKVKAAKSEYAEATASKTTDEKSAKAREHRLERARAKQAMAGKK